MERKKKGGKKDGKGDKHKLKKESTRGERIKKGGNDETMRRRQE